INPFTNISEQGPFDVILHKIPEFLNCDSTTSNPPISLRCLLTRFDQFSMLRDLVGVWSIRKEIFVPKFCLLSKNDPTELCEAGISYPVVGVCKSLMAHGQDSVHEIAIVFDDSGLNNLRYPIFVQQFINHNGKVLKLFVIGDYSCVTEVPSIKNQENSIYKEGGLYERGSVSQGVSSSFSNKQTICSYDKPLFNMLANEIRKSLKIDLFGIDLICETDNSTPDTLSKPNRYAIIDLNIFPSQLQECAWVLILFREFNQGKTLSASTF
ncbi:Inositol-tetrakisphosphate 1-kinase, partial [Schistosoma japonicum]